MINLIDNWSVRSHTIVTVVELVVGIDVVGMILRLTSNLLKRQRISRHTHLRVLLLVLTYCKILD